VLLHELVEGLLRVLTVLSVTDLLEGGTSCQKGPETP
jgi:hypothetical protein